MRSLLLMLLTANVVCAGYTATVTWGDRDLRHPSDALPALPPLRLLAERPGTIRIREPTEPAALACAAWGPFSSAEDARAFGAKVATAGGFDVVSGSVAASRGFLVYVPAEDVRANDGAVVRRLQVGGIESRRVVSGDLADARAVGIFAREDAAEAEARDLKTLGVSTRVVPLVETSVTYHLVADGRQDGATPQQADECAPIAATERFL